MYFELQLTHSFSECVANRRRSILSQDEESDSSSSMPFAAVSGMVLVVAAIFAAVVVAVVGLRKRSTESALPVTHDVNDISSVSVHN